MEDAESKAFLGDRNEGAKHVFEELKFYEAKEQVSSLLLNRSCINRVMRFFGNLDLFQSVFLSSCFELKKL